MAVKIKLKRLGKIRAPYYRIIVADARTKRDGRAIEEIGKYHPKAEPSFIEVNSERAQHWLSVGAEPTDPVRKIFEITGDWQKFKGLPGAEGTLKMAAPKEDRKEIFAAAVKENMGDSTPAPKGKGRSAAAKDSEATAEKSGKAAAKDTGSAKAESAKAESPKAESAKAEKPAKAKADQQDKAKSGAAGDAESGAAEDAKDDAKAKDTAKDSTAKDSAAKDSAAKESNAKDAPDAAEESAAQPEAVAADAESASGD